MTPKEHLPTYPPNRLAAILLGADAGGSHSAVAMGREDGTVLGRAEGPGAAMRPGGAAASVVVLADIARRAVTQAVVSLPVDRAVVGAAGAGRAQEQQELAAALVAAGIARAGRGLAGAGGALAPAFRSAPGIIINARPGPIAHAPGGARRRPPRRGYGRALGGGGETRVALGGVLLSPPSPLAAVLQQTLAADMPRARLQTGPVDTAVGALRLAALA